MIHSLSLDSPHFRESSIEVPVAGGESDVFAIPIAGWVLGREARVVAVNVMHEGSAIHRIPVSTVRRDVAEKFQFAEETATCGFETSIGLMGVPLEFELRLQAIFDNGRCAPLAVIRGRRQPLRSRFEPKLRPIMVTNLGRSGSTLLMQFLAAHPRIIAHRLDPFETRAAGYWLHMLRVLSAPANHDESAHPNTYQSNHQWIGYHPHNMRPVTDDAPLRRWFGRDYIEELAEFCQRSAQAFYERVAAAQGVKEPVYFAEKHHPNHTTWLTWDLYGGAREIILVRDFRDMVCSMLGWYRKRGLVSFGRDAVTSDSEFILTLRTGAERMLRNWRRHAQRAHLVRYEDLIADPRGTVTVMLEYLGLDAAPSTVESMIAAASQETPELQRHRTSQDSISSIGRWRRELDVSLQAVCWETFGDILTEFGYAD